MSRGAKVGKQLLLGITGTAGAGKGAVVDYLVDKYGFLHLSVRNFLLEEIRRRGLENVNRNVMGDVANELRRDHSPSYIVETLFSQAAKTSEPLIVIESVRVPAEIHALRNKAWSSNFRLLSVDADSKLRYERISRRNSETDHVTYDEFMVQEQLEMHNVDKFKQNLHVCAEESDFAITNNGSLLSLHQSIDVLVAEYCPPNE